MSAVLQPDRAALELYRRRIARTSLERFALAVDIPGAPVTEDPEETMFRPIESSVAAHHLLICREIQRCMETPSGRLMILAPPGSAKALTLDTPIPTPTGWTMMGRLRVGDLVYDETGSPCRVTWVSPVWRDRPVYAVRTDCGDTIMADRDHEWRVRLCGKSEHQAVIETHDLARRRHKRPMVTRAGALICQHADLPVDPYLLGLWLGDGHSAGLRITAAPEDQEFYRQELARRGIETRGQSSPMTFSVIGQRAAFVRLGLLHDPAHNTVGHKHIPAAFLRASYEQRLALLQGLIDTDGTICRRSGCATYTSTLKSLAEDVRELVRTMGVKAGWSESRAILDGRDCGPAYRVTFYLQGCAKLPRKASLTRNQQRTPNTYLDAVPAGIADTVCIEVDSPSHLFLAGRSMTPTHNSTYGAVVGPVWAMGRWPGTRIILTSYASTIAQKHSRRGMQLARSATYRSLWQEKPAMHRAAAEEWTMSNGSEMMAAGILAGITGNRAHGIVIDDPIAGREEADSPTIQAKTAEAWRDDVRSRLYPGGWVILINTRWHENDLSGQILPDDYDGRTGDVLCKDGRVWRVVNIPARAERDDDPIGRRVGEYLWPEWFPASHWQEVENDPLSQRTWSSLYQQRPVGEGIGDFRREWFKLYEKRELPGRLEYYMASDIAVATADHNDMSEHGVFGMDEHGNLWAVDWWHGKEPTDVTIEAGLDLIERWKPQEWWDEGGVIDKAIRPAVNRRMRERRTYATLTSLPQIADKRAKAQSFRARASAGAVRFPAGKAWAARVIDQLVGFPAARYDDAYDVCGLIGRGVDAMREGEPPPPPPEEPIKPFTERWLEYYDRKPQGRRIT